MIEIDFFNFDYACYMMLLLSFFWPFKNTQEVGPQEVVTRDRAFLLVWVHLQLGMVTEYPRSTPSPTISPPAI